MICKFCGNVIEDNSDFCFICGQKFTTEKADAPVVENNNVFSQSTLEVETMVDIETEAEDVASVKAEVKEPEITIAEPEVEITEPAAEEIIVDDVADAEEEADDEVEETLPMSEDFEIPAEVTAPASPDAPVLDSTAPIYAQSTPIYAQTAPVYAQQVIIQHVAAPTVTKAKKEKDLSVASTAAKIFAAIFSATFILQFIGWIWYSNASKAGYEKKATDILNAIMTGLCIFLGIICLVFIKIFIF